MTIRFHLFKTIQFEKRFDQLDHGEQTQLQNLLDQLVIQGDIIGKPLAGKPFFREKKFGGKRVYYLFYREFQTIFVVGLGNKKQQQETIGQVLAELPLYRQSVIELLKWHGLI